MPQLNPNLHKCRGIKIFIIPGRHKEAFLISTALIVVHYLIFTGTPIQKSNVEI